MKRILGLTAYTLLLTLALWILMIVMLSITVYSYSDSWYSYILYAISFRWTPGDGIHDLYLPYLFLVGWVGMLGASVLLRLFKNIRASIIPMAVVSSFFLFEAYFNYFTLGDEFKSLALIQVCLLVGAWYVTIVNNRKDNF